MGQRLLLTMVVLCLGVLGLRGEAADPAKNLISYDQQIRPIFQARCHGCHQPAKAKGEYVMTTFKQLLAGGESGDPAIVAKHSPKSLLVEQITLKNGKAEMPPKKKPLDASQIALIKKWIDQGALDDTPPSKHKPYSAKNPPRYTTSPVITAIDHSPDGKLMAVSGFHEVLLHRADGSGLVARLIGLSARIESVAFSPDGQSLAVTGGQPGRMGEVQIWNVAKAKLSLSVPVTFDTVYGAAWSPDGKHVSFGCTDSTVRAIDAKTGKQVFFQGAHDDWARDTVFGVKGDHIVSVGRDRTVKLHKFTEQRFIDNITSITPGALKGGVVSVSRDPKKDEVLVGGVDGIAKIFRMYRTSARKIGDNANLIRKFPKMPGRIYAVSYAEDGKQVAAASSHNGTGTVHIYPQNETKLATQATVADSTVYAISFAPDGKTIVAGGSDGRLRLISTQDGSIVKSILPVELKASEGAANVAKIQPDPYGNPLAKEVLPPGVQVVGLVVEPKSLQINGPLDYVQLLVQAKLSTGEQIDVTRQVAFQSKGVQISPRGVVTASKNGAASITATLSGQSITLKGKAVAFLKPLKIDYIRDVTPILSRLGCNAGTCHGSKDGQNGFKLSLRGYDAQYDVRALTDDLAARRINRASPDNSLMLLKATGLVPHEGDQLTQPHHKSYQILRAWIAKGAKLQADTPKVQSISIHPKDPVIQRIGSRQQMRIVARYADGTQRDVTAEAFIESGNQDVTQAEKRGGIMTALRRGEAPVLARYEGAYAATTVTVMGDRSGFAWTQPSTFNPVDQFVAAKWQRMKILPSPIADDATFLRRVHLDLTGLPPTPEQTLAFLADPTPTQKKRNAVVDQLVGSDAFVEHWTNKWADLLQVNRKFLGTEGATAFRKWIHNEIKSNTPYDQFVRKIITASGSNKQNPAASYYKILRKPAETMENTTHLFLATRFNCNKCHDHPFERWNQDNYYQLSAYFAQTSLKKDPASGKKEIGKTAVEKGKPLYEIVSDMKSGDIKHERTGQIAAPAFPYEAAHQVGTAKTRRQKLAAWLTAPSNPYFAKSYVNRLWGYMLGVGIIEPVDDIRAGNPPTNPELLDWLTDQFIENNFDAQHIFRIICKSRTYQLSIETNRWNADDQINYSHAKARRLPAEVLYDAIYRTTGAKSKLPGVPAGMRAAQLPDSGAKLPSGFLANLGRPPRESACECERSNELQLGPIIALINGPEVGNAISDPNNKIANLAASKLDDGPLVNALYMQILNRPATEKEVATGKALIQSLEGEHQQLAAKLKAYQDSQAERLAARQKARQERITQAQQTLTVYEKSIAQKELEANKAHQANIAAKEKSLKAYEATEGQRLAAWEKSGAPGPAWVVQRPTKLASSNGAKLTLEADGSIVASGKHGKTDYTLEIVSDLQGVTGVRLEAIADKRFPKKGPGRSSSGNFVLTELELYQAAKGNPKKMARVGLANAKADHSQKNYPVKTAIDGRNNRNNNGWAIHPKVGSNRVAVFETKQNAGKPGGTRFKIVMKQHYQDNQHALGRFRISLTTSKKPIGLGLPANIGALLAIAPDKRNDKQIAAIRNHHRRQDGKLKSLQLAVANAKKPRAVDPKLKMLRDALANANQPLAEDPLLKQLTSDVKLSEKQLANPRLTAAQDIAWALINSPAFLFNH